MSFTESLDKIIEQNRNHLVGTHSTWCRVPLANIASILNGFPFESRLFTRSPAKAEPLIRIRDVVRGWTDTYYSGAFDPAYVVKNGDLLVGMDGDFNSSVWRGTSGLLNQRVCKVNVTSAYYEPRFLAYCLPGYLSAINANTSSITVKHLSSNTLACIPLPLAPLREQAEIADALDELFSDLDAGVAALERVRGKLRLYRASVLKAAVEGTLTAEWRTQHPHTEPATERLKRILAERRRLWEVARLGSRKKYKEPIAPDPDKAVLLPGGWIWGSFDQVVWHLRSGNSESSGRKVTDWPVLRSSAVRHGVIDLADLNYLQKAQSLRSDNFLQRRDFLITRLSGSVSYVGCSAAVKDTGCDGIQYPDRIFCAKLVPGIDGTFLSYCFQQSGVRKKLEEAAKSTAGHQRISISDLLPLSFPLPPLSEQEMIVECVEDQLSVIDHLDADIKAKVMGTSALRQSILRHAFTGQLVMQDPNDEPASELLKRMSAVREAASHEKSAGFAKKTRNIVRHPTHLKG